MSDPVRDAAIDELLRASGEAAARRWLRELGTAAALRDFDRRCAKKRARQLLDQDVDRPVIRDRLMTSYGFSERTAYRLIESALCQKPGSFGTPAAHDLGIDTATVGEQR